MEKIKKHYVPDHLLRKRVLRLKPEVEACVVAALRDHPGSGYSQVAAALGGEGVGVAVSEVRRLATRKGLNTPAREEAYQAEIQRRRRAALRKIEEEELSRWR